MKDMKLLMENWRQFTNEQEVAANQPSAPLFPGVGNYEKYIKWLGANVQDPKTQAFLKAGEKQYDGQPSDDIFKIKKVAIPVVKLRPTQNEIGVAGSLEWPLKKIPKQFIQYAGATAPITPPSGPGNTDPIVTFNGKWVIDGHHRWSTLYACNANAEIVCYNITNPKLQPVEMLKAVQAAIAKEAGKVPAEPASGVNLLKSDEATVKGWIMKNAHPNLVALVNKSPEVSEKIKGAPGAPGAAASELEEALEEAVAEFIPGTSAYKMKKKLAGGTAALSDPGEKDTLQQIANYVWRNVSVIQKTAKPAPGAPVRDLMPQTGNAPNWKATLQKGDIDIAPPYGAQKMVQAATGPQKRAVAEGNTKKK